MGLDSETSMETWICRQESAWPDYGILSGDVHGHVTYYNSQIAALLGHPSDRILGSDLHQLLHPTEAQVPCGLSRALAGGTPNAGRTLLWSSASTCVPVRFQWYPLPHTRDRQTGVLAVKTLDQESPHDSILAEVRWVWRLLADGVGPQVLAEALIQAMERIDCRVYGAIWRKTPAETLELWAISPRLEDREAPIVAVAEGQSSSGTAAWRKQAVMIPHISTCDQWPSDIRRFAHHNALEMSWSEPIVSDQGEVLGVWSAYAQSQAPLVNISALLQAFTPVAALAMSRGALAPLVALHEPAEEASLPALAWWCQRSQPFALAVVAIARNSLVRDVLRGGLQPSLSDRIERRLQAAIQSVGGRVYPRDATDFWLVIPDVADSNQAEGWGHRLWEVLSRSLQVGNHVWRLRCEIGLAVFPSHGLTPATLTSHAHSAMRNAGQRPIPQVQVYSGALEAHLQRRAFLEGALIPGIEGAQFSLVYQPKVDIKRGTMVGAEALVRWDHPQAGRIMPNEFIPLAEETGLIVALGEWVLEQACRQLRTWQLSRGPHIPIAVNVSPRQFQDPAWLAGLCEILSKWQIHPRQIEVEITESAFMQYSEQLLDSVARLRAMGTRVALDDFGTGYSSLGRLNQLPVDTVKIDQSFVQDLHRPAQAQIVSAMIDLGHRLDLGVVAEGVETRDQWEFLVRAGCDQVQGFWYGRPMGPEGLTRFCY